MPVTVRGGDILFNDGTTQSTAAGAVNTTSVLNATAGASLGAVGSYAILCNLSGPGVTPGSTVAASNLYYAPTTANLYVTSPRPSGTWRLMGAMILSLYSESRVCVYLRIS